MKFKKGYYRLMDIEDVSCDSYIIFRRDTFSDITMYDIPCTDHKDIPLHYIIGEFLVRTIRAEYDENGDLKRLIGEIDDDFMIHEKKLLYINYYDDNEAKEEISKFAKFYSETIGERIIKITQNYDEEYEHLNKVSRVFVLYKNEGNIVDLHALVANEGERRRVMRKFDFTFNACDFAEFYPGNRAVWGSPDDLRTYIFCSKTDYFDYAVNIMCENLYRYLDGKIDKDEGFKFIISEFDDTFRSFD